MRIGRKTLRFVERGLLLLGVLLLLVFALAHLHRFVMFHAEMKRFERRQAEFAEQRLKGEELTGGQNRLPGPYQTLNADFSLWSAERLKLYRANLDKSSQALGVLRIPRLKLEVPVLEGTDELTLNRGVGRIAGTSRPGQGGNIGIAGHRDGFFRSLKDIRTGDLIAFVTPSRTDIYAVDRIRITSPPEVSVLESRTKPTLTLVTCYPFYFVGPAPERYVVEASLKQ